MTLTPPSKTAFHLTPPPPGRIGAEVRVEDPLALTLEQASSIRDAMTAHKLVVFRGIRLDAPSYIEFARKFGRPQIYFQDNYHHPDHPEIFVSSNQPMQGQKVGVAGTGRYWHTDYQFFAEPLSSTMVYPQVLPNGKRETYYVDMERAWRELPADLRALLEGRHAIHEAKWRYKVQACDIDKSITEILAEFGAITPTIAHPAVIRHPVNARELLYVSEGFTVGVEGLSYEAGRDALARIHAFVQAEERVHTHEWSEGDVLYWDNRQVIHKASDTPPGQPSVSFRIGVYDEHPFYVDGTPRVLGTFPGTDGGGR